MRNLPQHLPLVTSPTRMQLASSSLPPTRTLSSMSRWKFVKPLNPLGLTTTLAVCLEKKFGETDKAWTLFVNTMLLRISLSPSATLFASLPSAILTLQTNVIVLLARSQKVVAELFLAKSSSRQD